MYQRVTQADVARRAGVSRALVSLVLRESPHVSDERRQAVLTAMADLGYRPDAAARNLGRRTHTIGVMVQDLHHPFFAEVIDGLQQAAQSAGYQLLITTGLGRSEVEEDAVEKLLELRMDGIVLIAPRSDDTHIELCARSVPTVLVGRSHPAPSVDAIWTDDVAGGRLATSHLVELGHRRILAVTAGDDDVSAQGRRDGYARAMADAGLTAQAQVVGRDGAARGSSATWFSEGRRPTAIFAHDDVTALEAWARFGGDDPDDLAVVGYDNTSFAALPRVSLTSVDQPRELMGRTAVDMIVERLAGRTQARHRVFDPTLVIRSSSRRPPS